MQGGTTFSIVLLGKTETAKDTKMISATQSLCDA